MEKISGFGVGDGIHEFLRRTGIKYTDLVELIKTKFINPHQDILEFLEALFVNSTIGPSAIYTKLQQIDANPSDPSDASPADTSNASSSNRSSPDTSDPDILAAIAGQVTAHDFTIWVKSHFNDFNSVITLYQSNSLCDLNTTYLKTIQNVYANSPSSGITGATWSKIHRFIRLWRKLDWQIHEVDLMLVALGEDDITDITISKLANVVLLNKELNLPINKLATLWGSIDTYGDQSLYKKLFLNKAVQRIDSAFVADSFGNYLADPTQLLDDHIPAILAAFRMSEDDFNAIIGVARVHDNGSDRPIDPATDLLSLHNLNIIYQYTLFSKALKLKVSDFCLLLNLFRESQKSTVITNIGLNVSIPTSRTLASKYKYEASTGQLTFIGIMTETEKALLQSLGGANNTFVSDIDKLFALSNRHPFSKWDMQLLKFININPYDTLSFYGLLSSIKKAGFTPAVLQYICEGALPAESTLALDQDKVKQAVKDIRQAFAAIEQNYPTTPSTPLTADLLKSILLLSFKEDVVNQLIGVIGSQQTFKIVVESGPAVIIPAPLSAKYNYNSSSGEFNSNGIMSDADRLALKALAAANDTFCNAVDALYTLSRTIAVGSPAYSVITDVNLGVVISDPLSPKFTYSDVSGRLTCTGIMSGTENLELKGLNGANQNTQSPLDFPSAVDLIYKMPADFIRETFSGVFASANVISPNEDLITLLNRDPLQLTAPLTEKTLAQKLQFVYDNYLPLIKQKLHEDAVVQRLATLIGLNEETTLALIKGDLQSLVQSISLQGFSAEYSPNVSLNVPSPMHTLPSVDPISQTDNEINFTWKTNPLDSSLQVNNFNVHWQSYLSPPSSGEYTFTVEVPGSGEAINLYIDNESYALPVTNVPTSWKLTAQLNAAQMYKLDLKYSPNRGSAGIKLSWQTATTAPEIIHADFSFPVAVIDDLITKSQTYNRAAQFISVFKLNEKEINHFIKQSQDFDNIDFKAITPTHWKRINDYVQLRNGVPQSQALLIDVFAAANIVNPAPLPVGTLANILYLATAWDFNTLSYLITSYFTLTKDDFKNEISLIKIYNAVSLVLKTGLSAQTLAQWAAPETDFDQLNATAGLVRNTVKAKYEEEDWLKLAGNLSDKIRENQKQALISYLLTQKALMDWGVTDADGLFEYFLIDVQMGTCMDTSRIVQATIAVQTFVNRCLLNLESRMSTTSTPVQIGVSPDAIDRDRWEWMKQYRVWEANRKIFLYPENWLEPEWRDDRSAFFKELESELTQNDISDSSVETAFRGYLAKLNTVANLDVCGMYQENDEYGSMKLLHVFGRTHNAPYQFFYRTCSEFYKWSAWEKVEVDIRMTEDGDKSGVHLLPVVWRNRLFIFWAEFIEKQEQAGVILNKDGKESSITDLSVLPSSSLKSNKYWEMRLAWSENVDGKWNSKQLSKEFVKINSSSTTDPIKKITLISYSKPLPNLDYLVINIYSSSSLPGISNWYGLFGLMDIQSQIFAIKFLTEVGFNSGHESSKRYTANFEKHISNSYSPLIFWNNNYLAKPNQHNLVFSNNVLVKEESPNDPFFYQDINHIYFVRNVDISYIKYFISPQLYEPSVLDNPQNRSAPPADSTANDSTANNARGVNTNLSADSLNVQSEITDSLNVQAEITEGPQQKNAFGGAPGTGQGRPVYGTVKKFEFNTFYHPYSSRFVTNLNQSGIKGLMDSDTLRDSSTHLLKYNDGGSAFEGVNNYNPNFSVVVKAPSEEDYRPGKAYTYYKENVCFDVFGTNSIYNWELFFHAPLYIATRLSKNGKFEEAMKWFHYIFDPTTDEMPLVGHETSRYWKTLPFKTTPKETLEQWFQSIGVGPNATPTAENSIIAEWRDNPFNSFIVARNRPIAFMKDVVIKYVENLRAWGDSLFRTFTRESVNEALQLYVIANHILGPRPEFVPKRGEIKAETYNSLANKWDDFSNALVQMENAFPYSSAVPVSSGSGTNSPGLLGIGKDLYFCIPSNEKLMEHWDTIADRLFKIRHCMNIDGVEQHLALFSPPIDPGMLMNAAAQGISLGSILSDLSSPPPIYRFTYLIQKANEFCNEVKSLGSSLLAALEKKDGEELGRLRASHESAMLDLMTSIKERQVLDAKVNKEGLLKSRQTAEFRLQHYYGLMYSGGIPVPSFPSLDAELNDDSQLPVDTSINTIGIASDESMLNDSEVTVKLISKEKEDIDRTAQAMKEQRHASGMESLATMLAYIPQFHGHITPFGMGMAIDFGGKQLSFAASTSAKVLSFLSSIHSFEGAQAAKIGSYVRREQDWALQANLAAKEIIQLDKQITSADIKIQISEKELSNHKKQIENSKQVEQYLKDKFTNQELYQWMKEQLFSVYKESFNMAYDMAKKAEKCYQYELGNGMTSFIQYGYWDNTMQGLVAGEKLHLALRQLEKSYIEENKRELELSKSISIALLSPLALQELRTTGKCFLSIPEELYDLDYQGHYFRRIKSVSLSLPCIAGPYTTVNCTLRLLKNTIRINTSGSDYEHANDEGVWIDDDRFRESNVPVKAVATSTGQRDSGMFELSFRDERYLPFEGAGAISEWKIELTQDADLRQFDYSTIADVILHISFTAREDAGLFKTNAVTHLKNFLMNAADLPTQPLIRMFSMKHEFSNEWHQFLYPLVATADQILAITFQKEHFPFFTKDRSIIVKKVEVLMKSINTGDYTMEFTGTDNNNPLTLPNISMPENVTYGNMQKATLSDSDFGQLDVSKPMTLKFKQDTPTADYQSIDTDPEEISDVFVVLYYALGDII